MLTVLIATRNGEDTLPRVLPAYRELDPPPGGWRMVIVDNGSTDRSGAILQAHRASLPLTPHFEALPGKNAALNAGLALVSGDLVVLTDDDTIPRPDWLRRLRAAADDHPEFDVFGGRIELRWPRPPDAWLLRVPLSPVYGETPDLESGPVRPTWVFGGNMAIRKRVFDAGYRFDSTIGPRGSDYVQGSEVELSRRLAEAGYKAWHCRDAVVEHLIHADQMTEEWVLRRAQRFGRGSYRLAAAPARSLRMPLVGVPAGLVWGLVKSALRVGLASLRGDREASFRARWDWNLLIGKAREARLERHAPAARAEAAPKGPSGQGIGEGYNSAHK
jgi:L-malate glycosyltransferase